MDALPHPAPRFPVRAPMPLDIERFRLRMKRGVSDAIRASGLAREDVAQRVEVATCRRFSRGQLDRYLSPAKVEDISLVRFKALARAVGAAALWDLAIVDDGLLVIAGDEARLAEIGRLQQEIRRIDGVIERLRAGAE